MEIPATPQARSPEPGTAPGGRIDLLARAGEPLLFEVGLPNDPRAAGEARYLVRAVLDTWRLERLVEPVTLAASELVTNAVVHTTGPVRFRLRHDGVLRLEVHDRLPRLPDPGPPDLVGSGGRGLLLVAAVADVWGWRPEAGGKTVWGGWRVEA